MTVQIASIHRKNYITSAAGWNILLLLCPYSFWFKFLSSPIVFLRRFSEIRVATAAVLLDVLALGVTNLS